MLNPDSIIFLNNADQQSHNTTLSDDTPGSKYLQDEAQQAGKSKRTIKQHINPGQSWRERWRKTD